MTAKTEPDIKAMTDEELEAIARRATAELEDRRARRREETIARIKALAGEADLVVTFASGRRHTRRPRAGKAGTSTA